MRDERTGGVEVELKFPIADPEPIRSAIRDLGGYPGEIIRQIDTYFAHPVRDFAKSDEALRVRIVGETGCITYKGPLLDQVTKSREETELWLEGGAAGARQLGELFARLGFQPVRSVHKTREQWSIFWQERHFEAVVDRVEDLGMFIELETVASPDDFVAARDVLLALAETLGLRDSERRSYLTLLLERDGA